MRFGMHWKLWDTKAFNDTINVISKGNESDVSQFISFTKTQQRYVFRSSENIFL